MLESLRKNETFEYQKLTPEEMKAKGILGHLVGPCADFLNPTRNGRGYNEELWEKVFNNPIVNEKIDNKCLFGEMGHPADRDEVDLEKIALALNEKPKKNADGKLMACFDILDTPNGRILKTLCDYGTTIGISSRGTGDVIEDDYGNQIVDPDTYNFECFDAVIIPAVKDARLNYVNESLDTNSLNLRKALRESLEHEENEDHKKVMTETLNNLGINLTENGSNSLNESGNKLTESNSSETNSNSSNETNNDGSEDIIKSLQEAVSEKNELLAEIQSLQEKLAASDTRVNQLNEEVSRYKLLTERLSSTANKSKEFRNKVSTLEEDLKVKTQTINQQQEKINKLNETISNTSKQDSSLNEALVNKDKELLKLNESLASIKEEYETKINNLNNQLTVVKSDSSKKIDDLRVKLTEAIDSSKHYKTLVESVLDSYITSKARMLGVNKDEIIAKLPKNVTIEAVDSICENLRTYALNLKKLPYGFDRKVKVSLNEATQPTLNGQKVSPADEVDKELLRRLANSVKGTMN